MEPQADRTWKIEFARSAAYRHEQERFFRDAEKRQREERDLDKVDDGLMEFAVSALLATTEDIAKLRLTLDRYDADTVEALMENQHGLDAARERIDAMLGKAYVLPDGRRVFRSRDGLRVVDEHGLELGPDEIDPALIEEWRPYYEDFEAEKEVERLLLEERAELIAFQERIDEARELLENDDLTKADIAAIEADLEISMPSAVRRRQPEFGEGQTADMGRDFGVVAGAAKIAVPDLDLDMPGFGR